MVTSLPTAVFLLFQVIRNVFLEMRQSSIRDKDISECLVALMAHAGQLNLFGLVRKTLERQRNTRLTGKLDLQAQPTFQL